MIRDNRGSVTGRLRISNLPGSPFRGMLGLAAILLVLPLLAACGSGDDDSDSGQISWTQGTPPGDGVLPPPDPNALPPLATTTQLPAATEPPVTAPTATTAAVPEPTKPVVRGTVLTPEELELYQPNELGAVPVLMYHNIVEQYSGTQEGDVLFRTADELRADLQFLYDNDFYVVTMREYIENRISAPAGKHPLVLTFDDSRPSQFSYSVAADGSVSVDPGSAIAILEEFFSTHPDFGHTAVFGILPIHCFDFEEPSQTPYCQQKLQWLVDNGYEVANHTWDHQDLGDVSNDVFLAKVGDTTLWLEEQVGQESASNALILPYGVFPGGADSDQQWDWIRNGFDYDGRRIQLLTVVAAGAEPAPSPNSVNFDPMSIARIGAKDFPADGEGDLFFEFWFGQFVDRPDLLYTSDGNPDMVTIPLDGPGELAGILDNDKVAVEGKEVIEY